MTRLNFPSFAAQGQCTGSAAYYEILDFVYVNQPVHQPVPVWHGFTTVNDIFNDSTVLMIAFERMRSCFVGEDFVS